uniref:Globin domain-containing protein n=1 Tax=Noctiluca scintillans TaxID=2966 RepID=A0A7S0ZQE0_NOCSC|mmetsp:Transcript_1442/g.3879  ORF Transcript_1442/g.3879 Transcript_1442/m.3879 type:complete len:217 (+) Transcript_1442:61-711(+)
MGTTACCRAVDKADERTLEAGGEAPVVFDAETVPLPVKVQPKAPALNLNEPPVDVNAPLDGRDVALIKHSWKEVGQAPADEVAREIFRNIFAIAPGALELFHFKNESEDDLWREGGALTVHALKVVTTVDKAVSRLGNLDAVVPMLRKLGIMHVGYGVLPAHYDVVGQALVTTLGSYCTFTDPVKNAWIKLCGVIKATMVHNHYMTLEELLKQRNV